MSVQMFLESIRNGKYEYAKANNKSQADVDRLISKYGLDKISREVS